MMTVELLTDIIDFLKTYEEFENIRFTEEYPYVYKESPLKKITVSVGLEESAITNASIGNVVCIQDGSPIYGRQSEYKITLAIHVPLTMDGKYGVELFTKILDKLVFDSDFNIIKAGSRHIKTSRDMGAKALECWFILKDIYTLPEADESNSETEEEQP